MGLENNKFDGTYASILANGDISVKAQEGEPGAVKREYEDSQTKDIKIKWEKIYTDVSGYITGIKFYDGDYGKVLQVTFLDEKDEVVLNFAVNSNFAEDFMKKLPNIDFKKSVKIKPYSFENEKKKLVKGVTVTQDDIKLVSFFTEVGPDGKAQNINGLPAPEEGKSYDKDDWKVYFISVRKFLIDYTVKNIIPKIEAASQTIKDLAKSFGGEVVSSTDNTPNDVQNETENVRVQAEVESNENIPDDPNDIQVKDIVF